jgi:hypothetical protein
VSDVRFSGWNPVEMTIAYIRERSIDARIHRNDASWHSLCGKVCNLSDLFVRSEASRLLRICDAQSGEFPAFSAEA